MFASLLFHEYIKHILFQIRFLATSLAKIERENSNFVQTFQKEKNKLIVACQGKNVSEICQEMDCSLEKFQNLFLQFSSRQDSLRQINAIEEIMTDLRFFYLNIKQLKTDYQASRLKPEFELNPQVISDQAYLEYSHNLANKLALFWRKLCGNNALDTRTIHDFILENQNYSVEEKPNQLKKRIEDFLQKNALPTNLSGFISKSFLEYIVKMRNYVGNYQKPKAEKPLPSINTCMNKIFKNIEKI